MSQNRDDDYSVEPGLRKPFDDGSASETSVVDRAVAASKARGSSTSFSPDEEDTYAESIYRNRPEYADKLAERRRRAAARAAAGVRRVSGSMGTGGY